MKKYILFKLNPRYAKTEADVRFARMELETFFPAVKPLQTVFELLNYSDIKNLVEHDTTLQRIITHDLSYSPCQAFLAVDDNAPPIEKAIKRLALTGDILFFQRTHDNPHLYLQYLQSSHLLSLHTVFNWNIYTVPTLQKQMDTIRTVSKYEGYTGAAILNEPYIRALINWVTANGDSFFDASPKDTLAAAIAAEMNINTSTCYNEPILPRVMALTMNQQLINKGIQVFIERLNELLKQKSDRQSHLFFHDINTLFDTYKKTHVNTTKTRQLNKIGSEDQETILAAKFLLEKNIITEQNEINRFLYSLLLQIIFLFLRERSQPQFLMYLKENFKRFQEMHRLLITLNNQYALTVQPVHHIEPDKIDAAGRFDGMVTLNHLRNPMSPAIEAFLDRSTEKSEEHPTKIDTDLRELRNDEIKNLGVYTGKTLLYLKSINATEDFMALGMLFYKYSEIIKDAQKQLKNEGRFCCTVDGYTTPVIEIDIEAMFNDIAANMNFTLHQIIPLENTSTGKRQYIGLFEKN